MSYCAQDEANGKNKEEQIFTAFTSVVDNCGSSKQRKEFYCMSHLLQFTYIYNFLSGNVFLIFLKERLLTSSVSIFTAKLPFSLMWEFT